LQRRLKVGPDQIVAVGPLRVDKPTALAEHVRVVVINACFSAQAASATAPFVETAIDVAIADEGARHFAEGLYRGIGAGRSLAKAFEVALFEYDAELSGSPGARPVLIAAPGIDPAQVVLVAPQ
jgi:hypothetical protein